MKWLETITTRFYDTDAAGYVSPAMTLRLMEEVGNNQVRYQHPTQDELDRLGKAFLLNCLRINYYRPIRAYEELRVETWACDSKGVFFERCYRISKDNEPIAEVNSIWALVDLTDRRIHRVGEIELHYDKDAPIPMDKPTQTRVPADVALEKIAVHTVRYSETDYIHHMNNTRYLDMLCDYIPEISTSFVSSVGIKYRAEAPFGEQLEIYRGRVGNTYYFRTVRQDGKVNIEAEIELRDSI